MLYTHQPSTILYLRAKFQLQICCTYWDIVWRKALPNNNNSPTDPHPISSVWHPRASAVLRNTQAAAATKHTIRKNYSRSSSSSSWCRLNRYLCMGQWRNTTTRTNNNYYCYLYQYLSLLQYLLCDNNLPLNTWKFTAASFQTVSVTNMIRCCSRVFAWFWPTFIRISVYRDHVITAYVAYFAKIHIFPQTGISKITYFRMNAEICKDSHTCHIYLHMRPHILYFSCISTCHIG